MRIAAFCLADDAEVDDGRITITRGWSAWLDLPDVPHEQELLFVLIGELEATDLGEDLHLDLAFRHDANITALPPVHVRRDVVEGAFGGAPAYFFARKRVRFRFNEVGPCEIDVSRYGVVLATLRFVARLEPD